MALIPKEDIERIREKASIKDVISRFANVEKKGKNYVAICPFHDDHDPSLQIDPVNNMWHCFVCKEGGDVFSFVMKKKHIEFPDAVEEVADIIGYDLPKTNKKSYEPKIDEKTKHLYDLMNEVIQYSQYQLVNPTNEKIKQYILDRGITEDQIQRFQIGYIPETNLHEYLKKKGYTDQDIVSTGMADMEQKGLRDKFLNRLMIPIHDEFGNPIAFTARTMINDERKYINTMGTTLYKKSNHLYNMHRAKRAIRQQHYAILVEGPMDVMALERAGYEQVVASLGTAVTKEQFAVLKKQTSEVILSYDGDSAGQKANFAAGILAYENGFQVKVAKNDTGLDPDEIEKKYSNKKNQEIIEQSIGWLDFALTFLKNQYNFDSYEGKLDYIKNYSQYLKYAKDDFERDYYQNELATITGLSLEQIKKIQPTTPTKKVEKKTTKPNSFLPKYNPKNQVQYELIKQICMSYQAFKTFKEELGYFPDEHCQELAIFIEEYYRTHNSVQFNELLSLIPSDATKKMLVGLLYSNLFSTRYSPEIVQESIQKIKSDSIDHQLKEIQNKIDAAKGEELDRLLKQYMELKNKQKQGGS